MNCSIENMHEYLLRMAKDFHEVCARNGLTYYLIGGTFLGAVRHGGFIPWDDDMDVGMPRRSYEQLRRLGSSVLPSHLVLLDSGYGNKKTDHLYMKLCNRNTTLVEDVNERRLEGLYIDIFPLDGAYNHFVGSRLQYYRARFYVLAIWLNASDRLRGNLIKRLAQWILRLFPNQAIHRRASEMLARVEFDDCTCVANFLGAWGTREIMKREYFGKPTLYGFEDSIFYGPEQADSYLHTLYGDYMRLPPPEKRRSHHTYGYVNLELGYEEYARLHEKSGRSET